MFPLSAEKKFAVHVVLFLSWVFCFEFFRHALAAADASVQTDDFDPVGRYGLLATFLLYAMKLLSLLIVPQTLCNALGLLLFNGFRDKVELKCAPLLAPFVCFRVVTRGDFKALIKENLQKNRRTCFEAGIANFVFEVVTDRPLGLEVDSRVREIVVPSTYQTTTGAKFKARALQFCLEEGVSDVRGEDWIVHLDEETLLTVNSIYGILNFCADGSHQFGQGVITYAHGEVVNWLTTLADCYRVADDMGKLYFQLSAFHRPLFSWKGSFVVTKAAAEQHVSWDNGIEGSIAEDCFFGMVAMREGYSFDFIQGEMHEKSPFTVWDFLQQRKRWLQGIFLVVHSAAIPLRSKFLLGCSLYSWIALPFTTLQVVFCRLAPTPEWPVVDGLVSMVAAVNLYMYFYGAMKSFSHKCRQGSWRFLLLGVATFLIVPFNVLVENAAVLIGLCSPMDGFYVVDKQLKTPGVPFDI
ncbi:Glyco-trans-2-like domain-containing protein [Aphelenchoides fujianensis]|nr:Glyco-trans-2-like domain-containing protein [Aphelenchoides fujianensis]